MLCSSQEDGVRSQKEVLDNYKRAFEFRQRQRARHEPDHHKYSSWHQKGAAEPEGVEDAFNVLQKDLRETRLQSPQARAAKAVLGLNTSSAVDLTMAQLKAAYQEKAKQTHPHCDVPTTHNGLERRCDKSRRKR